MGMSEPVNIAIIGGGLMGREVAAAIQRWSALLDHPARPRLVAVCDINPRALEWFRQIETAELLTTDAEDVFASDMVDVVYVAVRHDLHEDLYTRAIRSGKDLFAEKPFGIDLPAAERVIREAESAGTFVRVSSEMPYFPGAQAVLDYAAAGAPGQLIAIRSGFLHSSDLDVEKPINWKRQARYCGHAGVMNDLGLHAWHVPLRLGWRPERLTAQLVDLVSSRPGPDGESVPADTWENASIHGDFLSRDRHVPLEVRVDRVAPGHKNTWYLEVLGMEGGARFTSANPQRVEIFDRISVRGRGTEQTWQAVETGSQSTWPSVTGGIFEFGFSDAILQMWASFLAERIDALGDHFGCATPQEAVVAHRIADAAQRSYRDGVRVSLAN